MRWCVFGQGLVHAGSACGDARAPLCPTSNIVRPVGLARRGVLTLRAEASSSSVLSFLDSNCSAPCFLLREGTHIMLCVCAWQDDLASMFQSAGNLVFDLSNSDNVNMASAQSKCQKVSYLSIGAEALFAHNPLHIMCRALHSMS